MEEKERWLSGIEVVHDYNQWLKQKVIEAQEPAVLLDALDSLFGYREFSSAFD